MSEQPTREEIEKAIKKMRARPEAFLANYRNEFKAVLFAACAYLASLDASAPLQNVNAGQFPENPVDVKPIPGSPKDGTREQQGGGGGGGGGSRSERFIISYTVPPVPQEGEMPTTKEPMTTIYAREIAALKQENARLKEAYEEAYGVNEISAQRDAAEARVKELEALLQSRDTP